MITEKEIESMSTNLPSLWLNIVVSAINKEKATHIPGSTSMFAESAACDFLFKGNRFHVEEFTEMVQSINLTLGKPNFVRKLISQHELDLSAAISRRAFRKAEEINDKIESLKRALPR